MGNRHRPVPSQTKTPKIHARAPAPKSGPEELVSAPIGIGHPKIAIPIPVSALPLDLFIPEPAQQPPVKLMLISQDGVPLSVTIAGKSFRRCIKAIVADGPMSEGQFVLVQGRLAPAGVIKDAGLSYAPKSISSQEPIGPSVSLG
ncbi:hypothetical protein [Castellaniella sp.]|uniref:hypothetical protein n=1 Tax=Castellaniella sp. TaxID=1955812 RepID=UPI002AFEB79B|nr:hypothetical protein [Castellaniella sp.]